MRTSPSRSAVGVAVGLSAALALTACGSSSKSSTASSSGGSSSDGKIATATDLASAGGMDALVAAAKKEGTLNVITLPNDWANYGNIIKDFETK